MNDEVKGEDKQGLRSGKTLSLGGRLGSNTVKQSFSHGRTNSVVVERKRRRINVPGSDTPESEAPQKIEIELKPKAPEAKVASAPVPEPAPAAPQEKLTDEQQAARVRALAEAKVRSVEEEKQAKIDEEIRQKNEAKNKVEREAAEAKRLEEETAQKEILEKAEQERIIQEAQEAALTAEASESEKPQQRQVRDAGKDSDKGASESDRKAGAGRSVKAKVPDTKPVRRDSERRQGRLTINKALSGDDARDRSLASFRRRVQREKRRAQGDSGVDQQKISRQVTVPETITIQELANRMSERAADVIKLLFKQGLTHQSTDVIDADTAQLLTEEMGHTVRRVAESDVEEGFIGEIDSPEQLKPRPPVITIMGHVDHGKTSLLDAIRQADVVSGEAGGITQHIGAYQITTPAGHLVTFLDTPGHAAFTSMRARGANTTDIVVLVVAADDGVKPQTIEAISHAKAAKAPIIVAINKIDRPGADSNRVRTELLSHDVQVESMGGEVLDVEVSALERTNIDKLLEIIHLQAEILELKANPDRSPEGAVVESRLDRGRGTVTTALIQRGTLRIGDIVVAGEYWGKARALHNERGEPMKEAGPSVPVEILGLSGAPNAGDAIAVVDSEAKAREITSYRERRTKELNLAKAGGNRISLEQMMEMKASAEQQVFTLLIKADVFGSVEAIVATLEKLSTDEVKVQIVHAGVGGISESDIALAKTTGAAVVGFNVRSIKSAIEAAERESIEIRYYNIIYNLVDDIKQAMEGLLAPELRETWLGNAEVLEVFSISKVGKIAGCRVSEGNMQRGAHVRLVRDSIVIHEGKLSTLKRFKDEVKEVQSGQECGMAFENYQDLKEGDLIECYTVQEIKRKLD